MKKTFLFIVLLSFLIVGLNVPVLAQDSSLPAVSGVGLPAPGITPDNPLYFLKTWKESIQTFFTFGVENKAKQFLHLAEVRLAEYQKMIEILRQAQDEKASQQILNKKTEIAQKTLDKYERQLNQAVEKAQEVQKKEGLDDAMDVIQERKIKHQGILTEVLTKAPEEAKQEITEKRSEKWMEFITEVRGKFPKLISGPVELKNIPVQVLLGCSVPSIPLPEDCEGGWFLNQVKGCPYFSCSSASKKQAQEPSKPVDSSKRGGSEKVCAQVITPAVDPKTNNCREFPTPCDVPPGWGIMSKKCPIIPTSSASPKPSVSSEPTPTEIRYYTCPDGIKVESGKCYGSGERFTCSIVSNPELQCIAMAPPVPEGGVCTTAGETKYHTCSNGTQVQWCACAPESSYAGAKNVWRCQHLPELSCPKPISPKPISTPVSQPVVCYIQKDCFFVENKNDCLKKGGNPSSESSCPVPAPLYNECSPGEKKDYQCPNGTPMPWCACDKTGKWSCAWDEPQIGTFCPFSIAGPPVISRAEVRDSPYDPFSKEIALPIVKEIIWSTNETADSFVEYGKTTSYDSTTPLASVAEFRRVTHKVKLSGLLSNTSYHFRIIAKDTEGNKTVSDDYTFTTGL
jgi:hypothetical protein